MRVFQCFTLIVIGASFSAVLNVVDASFLAVLNEIGASFSTVVFIFLFFIFFRK